VATSERCAAANPEDRRPCEGPPDAVRILDHFQGEVTGCVRHAAAMLASVNRARVYPGPAGIDGAAIEVFKRSQRRRPFDFVSDDVPEGE
jgi:hypothetical protein